MHLPDQCGDTKLHSITRVTGSNRVGEYPEFSMVLNISGSQQNPVKPDPSLLYRYLDVQRRVVVSWAIRSAECESRIFHRSRRARHCVNCARRANRSYMNLISAQQHARDANFLVDPTLKYEI